MRSSSLTHTSPVHGRSCPIGERDRECISSFDESSREPSLANVDRYLGSVGGIGRAALRANGLNMTRRAESRNDGHSVTSLISRSTTTPL